MCILNIQENMFTMESVIYSFYTKTRITYLPWIVFPSFVLYEGLTMKTESY